MTAGVRWLSVVPGSGYGDAGEAYRKGLRAAGVPVSWTPLGWPSRSWDSPYGPLDDVGGEEAANAAIEHDTVVVHSTPLWHARLREEAAGRALVAFTTWETDRLPPEWVQILNRYDRVLVPSSFNAAVFAASGVEPPVHVVPHIVRGIGPSAGRADGPFVCYLIATWTSRKAILHAVEAFLRAFSADDGVVLAIQTSREDYVASARALRTVATRPAVERETWLTLSRALAGRRSAPEITLGTRLLSRAEVDALHRDGDCFLLLSHGEGWGLTASDAAAAGNVVIVTGWGGTLDLLPDGYPYLVDCDLVATIAAEPDLWWEPRLREHWANARIDHAAALLRHVYEHPDEARAWGRTLRAHVRERFSEARVTRVLLDALAA